MQAKAGTDYLIVDVRSEQERLECGWIPGSVNIPSTQFEGETLAQVRQELKTVPNLYFHCALSQVRGPKCAQKYVTHINQSDEHSASQSVLVLRGGRSWQKT
ncbi:hypothetical protein HDV03_000227 [Kappamyces sp. JEL0829]|nr:hypothetical protein HDV03_000227 [Kappamyces sp. JEL0829]